MAGFGIYIHWPFCKAKCPYCDFNSHVRHEAVDHLRFARALARELAWLAGEAPRREVTSIFLGGGTPSLMPPAAVTHVLDAVAALWPVAGNCEVTLEANPTSAEAEHFRGYRTAGVNRPSVGVQSLRADDLKAPGRQHSPEEAIAAFRLAARVFPRVSFDLIYARPGQTVAQWRDELSHALSEQEGHMSLYQLTIEEGTRFFDLEQQGKLVIPDDDRAAELYAVTQELTARAGIPAYEISNHAGAGHECRHNLTYWRYEPYAGAGAGAHSRLEAGADRRAIAMERHPETWLAQVEARGHGVVDDQRVTPAEQATEYLLMGLRLAEGIDIARHETLAGRGFDPLRLAGLQGLGLIEATRQRLAATPRGRRVLNGIIRELNS